MAVIPVVKAALNKSPIETGRGAAPNGQALQPHVQKIPGAWDPKGPGAPVFSNLALRGTQLDFRNV